LCPQGIHRRRSGESPPPGTTQCTFLRAKLLEPANAELFNQRVLDAVKRSPTHVNCVVVTAEPVTSVDVTAADALVELHDNLENASIQLCFAEMKDPVKDKLKRFGLFARFGEKNFFATIDEVVNAYCATQRAEL